MKQIYHFSDQLGSVDCIPCPEKNHSGLAEPVEQDFLTTVHLESLGRQVSVGILTGSARRSARQELSKMADDPAFAPPPTLTRNQTLPQKRRSFLIVMVPPGTIKPSIRHLQQETSKCPTSSTH